MERGKYFPFYWFWELSALAEALLGEKRFSSQGLIKISEDVCVVFEALGNKDTDKHSVSPLLSLKRKAQHVMFWVTSSGLV